MHDSRRRAYRAPPVDTRRPTPYGPADVESGRSHDPPPQQPLPAQAPGQPQVVYVQQDRRTNGFSIASLVLGILWIWWIGSVLALVFGYIARGQIRRSQGTQGGDGMAIAGIVLGWIGVGVLALIIVLVVVGASVE